jgi:hypothetical protein
MNEEVREAIIRLEAEIEAAAEALERCRKFMLAGRISIAVGAVWLLAVIAGPLAGLASLAGATAALLGGIVVFGSNTMTAREVAARIQRAEDMRTQLINALAPLPVAGNNASH